MDELVSIVVPVYKVEPYICRCIDSILAQTYKNLEIVLIDDGSPDRCGIICDEYANLDKRIRVIHQKNKGLAEVRNLGLELAKGDYLQFVDSDDWIEPNTVERCIKVLEETGTDIVCFRTIIEYADGTKKHTINEPYETRILNTSDALSLIFFPSYVDVISCNKFIKKSILHDIEYPCGLLYEDMFTTYKIISNACSVACISDELYHYYQNSGSIGHYSFSYRTYDLARAARECYGYCLHINGTDKHKLNVGLWFWEIVVANSMFRAGETDIEYINAIRNKINICEVLISKDLDVIRKIQMLLFKMNSKLYGFFYSLYIRQNNHE